ncbi:MAG: glutaminyl-peptide cyclotransferase [Bacteroidia bacterium]|nr:glutaminyl-peptide cyclotransferase [Bacteroidia bacterium]
MNSEVKTTIETIEHNSGYSKSTGWPCLFFLPFIFLISCGEPDKKTEENIVETKTGAPAITFSVTDTLPHDTLSFTEGFLFNNGKLFESTGSPDNVPYTRSVFGDVDLNTGKINVKAELDRNEFFGEGILFLNDKIYQVTYEGQIGFVYDAKTFKRLGRFTYPNKEGWGLTTDGKYMIMSDGTNTLSYLDPITFKTVKTLNLTENGFAADQVNEIEYINGFIYGNVWMTNFIVKIDPKDGKILGKMDLTPLVEAEKLKHPRLGELNGIAYDSISDKILVTGKLWPSTYEIKFPH